MKKFIYLLCGCLCAVLLVACGNQKVTSGKNDIYQVKVTKTSTNDVDNWVVKGTTSAPDGAKVIAVGKDDDLHSNAASDSSLTHWSKVRNGKFKAHISSTDATGTNVKANQKCKVYLFAVTNYRKISFDDEVPHRILKAFRSKFDPTSLTITSKMARSLNDNDTDNVDDNSTDSNDQSDPFNASLQKSVDNWNGGDNSINVKKAWYKDHTTFIAVDIDDWDSLSTSEQQDFADNWLQSVQGLYRMSGKKGGTNVMIVDSNNHDHMLAHTRSLHDTMKLDD